VQCCDILNFNNIRKFHENIVYLLGKLKESSPSRIINVSSMAHAFVSDINLKNINSEIHYDAGKVRIHLV